LTALTHENNENVGVRSRTEHKLGWPVAVYSTPGCGVVREVGRSGLSSTYGPGDSQDLDRGLQGLEG